MTSLTPLDVAALYEPPRSRAPRRRWLSVLAILGLLALVLLPFTARAQDVPAPAVPAASAELGPVAAPVMPGVPDIDQAPLQFAAVLIQLAQAGRWGAFASLAIFAAVWLVRKFAGRLPDGKVREALLSKWGGWAMNFVSAVSAGFGAIAFVGAPVTLVSVIGILGGAVTYTLGAAGLVELQKDLTLKRATDAGQTAAAAIDSKAAAVATLEKGPPAD